MGCAAADGGAGGDARGAVTESAWGEGVGEERCVIVGASYFRSRGAAAGRETDHPTRRGPSGITCQTRAPSAARQRICRHFRFPTPDRSAFQFAPAIFHLAMAYPSITRPNTAVGLTRRKSNWRCFHGNAWGPAVSLIWGHFAGRAALGLDARTAAARKSTGHLTAKLPVASSATKGTLLGGQRPSPRGVSPGKSRRPNQRVSCYANTARCSLYDVFGASSIARGSRRAEFKIKSNSEDT